tara:strand:- start:3764 stop:4939 length:1176 start_codon:yes stop_codon:yes gene_type:complete
MGGCWKLTGNETPVSPAPDGFLMNYIGAGGGTFASCAACATGDVAYPPCEWYRFEACDCEDDPDCENLVLYVPPRHVFTRGGSCGGTCMDDVEEIFWTHPSTGCCMKADTIVTTVPDCCDIWTAAAGHDPDDCTVPEVSKGEIKFWRGCQACCNNENDNDLDECEVMADILSSWEITYAIPSCPFGGTDPQPSSHCASGAFAQSITFTIAAAPHADECTQQFGCMHHTLGASETVNDCEGVPYSLCQDGCVTGDPDGDGEWSLCWAQGSSGEACFAGYPSCIEEGGHCAEAWCPTTNYWLTTRHNFQYYITMCKTGFRALSIDLTFKANILIPYYVNGTCLPYCDMNDNPDACTAASGHCTGCIQNEIFRSNGYFVQVSECFPITTDADPP